MISPLRATLWSTLALALAACSGVNKDHCGNQDGNATCLQRDPATPYCSICVADNNGCLAAAPQSDCLAETAPATGADATSSAGTGTTASTTTPTTTVEAPTSTSTGTTDPTTATTTTPLDTSTSTGDTGTGGTGTSTSTSTGTADTSTSTSTGDTSTSDTTAGTTTGGPVCGDNKVEGDEVCDGNNFNGKTCETVIPGKWGGGTLACNQCMSLNDTNCCVGLGGNCGPGVPDAKLPCCGGLECKFVSLGKSECKSKPI
ncbi:MAG: hypothetical protein H0T76_22995 [Nannocystis sp.]|nr:hypothetical protein [Nannocystis sp.]MBA3549351.1 hypothetical protein [Nannocystis sp.]